MKENNINKYLIDNFIGGAEYNDSTYIGYLKIKNGGVKILPGNNDNKIIKSRDYVLKELIGGLKNNNLLINRYPEYFSALEGKYIRNVMCVSGGSECIEARNRIKKITNKTIKGGMKLYGDKIKNMFEINAPILYKKFEGNFKTKGGNSDLVMDYYFNMKGGNIIYYNKYQKYLCKINNFNGGQNKMEGFHNIPNTSLDLLLYYIKSHTGGEAENILPIIKNEYLKIKDSKYLLGVKTMIDSPENNKIKYKFVIHDTINIPAMNSGKYTAIYELKNDYDKTDSTNYILRLFQRAPTYFTDVNKFHMCDKKKIKEEYELFSKYLMNIYSYGVFNVLEIGKVRHTKIDYILTHKYNSMSNIDTFTSKQKYKFLYNNIQMLLDFRKQNYFLGDYKLSNIGWEKDFDIVLIDYDQDSIIKIDEKMFKYNRLMKEAKFIGFPYTYIPTYLTSNIKFKLSQINETETIKYDKFSIGGLISIIENLKFDIDLINLFKLNDENYDNILTYEQMLEIISTLK